VNNIVLLVCGVAVTLISGVGVLLHMVNLGYKHQEEILKNEKIKEVDAKIDADLGAIVGKKESFVEIPSVS
jgi:hypothetical protein